jgi:glutathione S-transferase
MLKIYTNPICPFAHRLIFALSEKNEPYERTLVPLSGEISRAQSLGIQSVSQFQHSSLEQLLLQKEQYKASLNSTGEVPTLVHGENVVTESEVVAEYVDLVTG